MGGNILKYMLTTQVPTAEDIFNHLVNNIILILEKNKPFQCVNETKQIESHPKSDQLYDPRLGLCVILFIFLFFIFSGWLFEHFVLNNRFFYLLTIIISSFGRRRHYCFFMFLGAFTPAIFR